MFQRFRLPGGIPAAHRGHAPWILRALYGATSFGLLAGAADPAYGGGHIKHHGAAGTTIQATGGAEDMARVQGPIVTRHDREPGVLALQPGAAVLSGPIETAGDDAYALYYSGAARIMMTDVDIVTRGARAHAVQGLRASVPPLSDLAESRDGDLEWRRGTITLQGPDSVGVDVTAPSARLGRPLRDPGAATLARMGYVGPTSAEWPDVRIQGQGRNNIGIAIAGRRRLELNGVGIDLREAGAVAMSVGASADIEGRNVGITVSGADSFGLRVRGDGAGRDDAARCPAPTSVKLARGHIAMTGRNSPAVEIVRGQVSLEDVSISTSQDARFAVGNEAGVFRMIGRQDRATIRGAGSALAAWTGSDRETASFHFRNVSIDSGSGSLLEVGRDHGESGPSMPASADLLLDDSDARGRIWSGPQAPRVNVTLRGGSSWQGHTDIGRTVTVETGSTWNMDGDSTIEDLVLDRGAIVFDGRPQAARDRVSATEAASGFHRLHVRRDLRGPGEIGMRADPASRDSDKILIDGRVHDDIVIAVRDAGAIADSVTSIDLLHTAQGGPASYTLPDQAERVVLGGHAFRLHKEETAGTPAVTVLAVPEGAPFIRGHATMDLPRPRVVAEAPAETHGTFDAIELPARRDDAVVVAETPARFESTFDTMELGVAKPPSAPVAAPRPGQGEVDRKRERDTAADPGGPPGDRGPDRNRPQGGGPVLKVKPDAKPEAPNPGTGQMPESRPEPKPGAEPEPDRHAAPDPGAEPEPTPEPTPGPEPKPEPDSTGEPQPRPDANPDGPSVPEAETPPPAHADADPDADADAVAEDEAADKQDDATHKKNDVDDGDGDNTEAEAPRPDASPSPSAEAPTPPAPPPPPIVLSPAAALAVNNAALAAGHGIWNAQLAAVNRRLRAARHGDAIAPPSGIHAIDGAGAGVWIEAVGARQKIDNPLTGQYRQELHGFVGGIDRAIDVAAGRWHIGLLAAQAGSRRDFDDGRGGTRSAHVGGYATFLGPRGSYATAIVATGRYRHHMHGKAADGKRLTGAFTNRGAGASLEAGRRVDLPHDWFVEPHLGVDYLRVGGARYTLSDGTPVRDRGGHALQGRAGARVGRVLSIGNGGSVTPYLRAAYAYERGNRNQVTVGGTALKADLGGSRLELGAGVEARLGKAYSLYLDAGYAKGRRFEQSRMVTIGLQYRW